MSTAPASVAIMSLRRAIFDGAAWRSLALMDIKGRYRRTLLGPFWLTISMAFTAISIGFVFGKLFNADMSVAIPYFVVGTVIWSFIAGGIDESATLLGLNGAFIRSSPMPVLFHILRMVHRNFFFMLHNALIIPVLWLIFPWSISWQILLLPLALGICYVFVASISTIVAIFCVRYRDLAPLVRMVTQFMYFTTPIIWQPQQMTAARWVVDYNPLAYLVQIVRGPLIGQSVDGMTWLVAIAITVAIATTASALYGLYSHRIAYWV